MGIHSGQKAIVQLRTTELLFDPRLRTKAITLKQRFTLGTVMNTHSKVFKVLVTRGSYVRPGCNAYFKQHFGPHISL